MKPAANKQTRTASEEQPWSDQKVICKNSK